MTLFPLRKHASKQPRPASVWRTGLVLLAGMVLSLGVATTAAAQLASQAFGSGRDVLVVVLHGDVSSGGPANYHFGIARQIAAANPGATVHAVIRPGYDDGRGNRSPGTNHNRRDQYTAANNKLVAQTIATLQQQTGAPRVVAIGHSGGAAQLGVVIGRSPGLVDSAILVSCPCNIADWRRLQGRSAWTRSQSPHKFLKSVSGTRIIAITGALDDNTFPSLAQDYVARAQKRGLTASVTLVDGAGHGFGRLTPSVLAAARQEIRR